MKLLKKLVATILITSPLADIGSSYVLFEDVIYEVENVVKAIDSFSNTCYS